MTRNLVIFLITALMYAPTVMAGDNGRPGFRYHTKAKITEVVTNDNLDNIKVGDRILFLKFVPIDGAVFLQDSKQSLMKGKGKKLRPSKYTIDIKNGDELYQVYPLSLDAIVFCSNTKVARRKKLELHACFIDRDRDGSFDEVSTEGTALSQNGFKYGGRFYKFRTLEDKISYSKKTHSGAVFGGVSITYDSKKTIVSNFDMRPNYWTENGVLETAELPNEISQEDVVSLPNAELNVARVDQKLISVEIKNTASVGDIKEFAFDNITARHYWNRVPPKPNIYELSLKGT